MQLITYNITDWKEQCNVIKNTLNLWITQTRSWQRRHDQMRNCVNFTYLGSNITYDLNLEKYKKVLQLKSAMTLGKLIANDWVWIPNQLINNRKKYLKAQVTSILVASSMDVRQIPLQNTLKWCLLLKGNAIVNSKIQMDWMSKDTQQWGTTWHNPMLLV